MDQLYKESLCLLCRESAFVEQLRERCLRGELVSKKEIAKHLELLVRAKESFIGIKKSLGMNDGLEFMEDTNFCGFRIKDGCLEGELENLPKIALAFLEEEREGFKYEVGILLLSHYFMQRGEYYGVKKNAHQCARVVGMLRKFIIHLLCLLSSGCGSVLDDKED